MENVLPAGRTARHTFQPRFSPEKESDILATRMEMIGLPSVRRRIIAESANYHWIFHTSVAIARERNVIAMLWKIREFYCIFFSNERLVFSEVYLASHFIRNAIIGILQQCWWKIVVIAKIFDFYQFIWNRSWLSSVYLDKHWINCEIMRISQWRLQEVNLYSKN